MRDPMNLKVEMTLRLDLNVPAGITPELIAALTGQAAEGMLDALAEARGVSKAAPVEVILGRWRTTSDDGLCTVDGPFTGRSG